MEKYECLSCDVSRPRVLPSIFSIPKFHITMVAVFLILFARMRKGICNGRIVAGMSLSPLFLISFCIFFFSRLTKHLGVQVFLPFNLASHIPQSLPGLAPTIFLYFFFVSCMHASRLFSSVVFFVLSAFLF